jgi:hypothetical protein
MGFEVHDSKVLQTAIFNSNYFPKDQIIDLETANPYVQWSLEQSRLGVVTFKAGKAINRNDPWYNETTDDIIDEDRSSKWDFAHSLGVIGQYQVSNFADNTIIIPFQSFDGAQQVPVTRLLPGQQAFGNGPVGNPEVRHYTVSKPGNNNITGALGSSYPYRIYIPKVSDINQKWKDLTILWYLNLRSVFDSENLDLGNTGVQQFKVFQKAISITKKIGGNIYANNASETLALSQSIRLDKAQNRGDGVVSSWIIQKKVGSTYVTAVSGVDYTFITGTLNADQIEVKFLITGDYKIINYSKGNSSVASGVNESYLTLNILSKPNNVTVTVDEHIALPKINPILTPISAFTNVTVQTTPILEGYERYEIIVTPELDLSQALYKKVRKEIDHDNSHTGTQTDETITLNNNQWLDMMLQKANVDCFIREKNAGLTFTEIKSCNTTNTFQHNFAQNNGDWEVGYYVTPK